jgi:hypothetical protein
MHRPDNGAWELTIDAVGTTLGRIGLRVQHYGAARVRRGKVPSPAASHQFDT